jgi:glycosyltransferase involved in cell wall biosynthesis
MSWFAPSLGWVARRAGARCKVVPVLDNVIPHEPHWFDKPLTKWFLGACDGFVTMSQSVTDDLLTLKPDARYVLLPHPLYSHFGEKLPREAAAQALGIDPARKTLLFFGLIRDYKGLDILLEAFRDLPEDYQLVVAGEPYGSFDKYRAIIDTLPGKDRVHVFPDYIRDSEVKTFFSAADVTVLPYRSATQSGISSISYHFEVPMIVTDVGGLKGTIGDRGTGIVAPAAEPGAIRDEILRYFSDPSVRTDCVRAIRLEKERLDWDRFCADLAGFAAQL